MVRSRFIEICSCCCLPALPGSLTMCAQYFVHLCTVNVTLFSELNIISSMASNGLEGPLGVIMSDPARPQPVISATGKNTVASTRRHRGYQSHRQSVGSCERFFGHLTALLRRERAMTTETQPPPPPSMKTPAEEVGAGQGRLERRTDGPQTDADESVDGQITGVVVLEIQETETLRGNCKLSI